MGRLIYVIGASGVGKDCLLQAARRAHPEWLIAHRYLTRESSATEECVALSDAEFATRHERGMLCLAWQAHGLWYGVGVEVDAWLERGATVLLNGSRRALPMALDRFGDALVPVVVTAPAEVVRHRLLARGRDAAEEIERRLERHREMDAALMRRFPDIARIDNGGRLTESLAELTAVINECSARA